MLEKQIEEYIRERLKAWGFWVLKFTCPGTTGVVDRIILRPRYSPGPPHFVEIKQATGRMAAKQSVMGKEFEARGCLVEHSVWNMEDAYHLCDKLIGMVAADRIKAEEQGSTER